MSEAMLNVIEGMFWMALITAGLAWYAIWDGRREVREDKSSLHAMNPRKVPPESEHTLA